MRKAISIVFLITLMSVLPSYGSAQAVPSPGDRIRIKQVDGTILTGTLANVSTETVQLAVDPLGGTIEVPVERIDLLETSLGQQRNFGKNFGVTVAVAAAVGGTITALTWSPCSTACPFLGPESRGEAFGWGLAGGAIIGLPIGVLVGLLRRSERWNPAGWPGSGRRRLVLRPVLGSRIGFAASVSVGGL